MASRAAYAQSDGRRAMKDQPAAEVDAGRTGPAQRAATGRTARNAERHRAWDSWLVRSRLGRAGPARLRPAAWPGGRRLTRKSTRAVISARADLLAVGRHVAAAGSAVADLVDELIARQAAADVRQVRAASCRRCPPGRGSCGSPCSETRRPLATPAACIRRTMSSGTGVAAPGGHLRRPRRRGALVRQDAEDGVRSRSTASTATGRRLGRARRGWTRSGTSSKATISSTGNTRMMNVSAPGGLSDSRANSHRNGHSGRGLAPPVSDRAGRASGPWGRPRRQ